MGWSGDFQIKYKGKNPKEFHKLAKMVIPNSIMRFDFDSCMIGTDSVELSCTRNLSWYSADKDMQKIMSYLPESDSISMEIDGEGDYEEVEIGKSNGQVTIKNSNDESERYTSSDIGIPEMLFEEMSPRYGHDDSESIDVCSLDGYIQLIANTFAGDERLMPVVQNFMYTALDKDKINSFAYGDDDKLSEEDCAKLDEMRAKFSSIESTSQFLQEQKKEDLSFESTKKQDIEDLPDWAKAYPKSVISSLGGANLLKQLIDTKGEDAAREIVTMLGGGIMQEMSMEADDSYDDDYSFRGPRR